MRANALNAEAKEALIEAQAGAIAAIGKRGLAARQAMSASRRGIRDARWQAICRTAWITRCNPPTPEELDRSTIGGVPDASASRECEQ